MVRASRLAAVLAVVLALAVDQAAAGRYCICPKTNRQVCGMDSQTYANQCVASCMKVGVRFKTACPSGCSANPPKTCICGSAAYSPYCVNGLTYASECTAKCAGVDASCGYKGICKYPGAPVSQYATPAGASNGFKYNGGGFPGRGAARHDYWKALELNYRFFESMRSGRLPKNNRISWRGDSCLRCRGKYGEDLSGGYYEAGGSYLKMTQIIAYTTAMLGWSADIGMSGLAKAGQKRISLDAIYWGAYYLVRGHVEPNKMIAQLGHRCTDFRYFGPPEVYERFVKKVFPAENPRGSRDVGYVDCGASKGSEIAAMSAAALAMGAKVFRAHKYRVSYARIMETHAKQLYNMAKNCQGSFAKAADKVVAANHARLYGSDGYKDDLAFAAAVMYTAFGGAGYLADARKFYAEVPAEQPSYANGYPGYHFDGKFMYPAVHVLMARIDGGQYTQKANAFLDQYINGGIPRTSRGLPYPFAWGALRVSANTACLSLMQSINPRVDAASRAKYFQYGEWIVNYILGDSGRSYLIGYGSGNPQWTWHKFSTFPFNQPLPDLRLNRIFSYKLGPWTQRESCNVKDGQAYMGSEAEFLFRSHTKPHAVQPVGALYGAPLQDDNIIFGRDYSYAEPTIDGNAGLTCALSILATHFNKK